LFFYPFLFYCLCLCFIVYFHFLFFLFLVFLVFVPFFATSPEFTQNINFIYLISIIYGLINGIFLARALNILKVKNQNKRF